MVTDDSPKVMTDDQSERAAYRPGDCGGGRAGDVRCREAEPRRARCGRCACQNRLRPRV